MTPLVRLNAENARRSNRCLLWARMMSQQTPEARLYRDLVRTFRSQRNGYMRDARRWKALSR